MKKGFVCCFLFFSVLVVGGSASAGDDFGIPSYPGAKSDAETQAVCAQPEVALFKEREAKAGLTHTKHCYRTKDPLDKVIGFYKKQKGLTGGEDASGMGASFCRGNSGCAEVSVGTGVSITNFWIVPKTMKVNNDVLITVTNRVKK